MNMESRNASSATLSGFNKNLSTANLINYGAIHANKDGSDFETAILNAGYGRYQYGLLALCGVIYAVCAISTTTLSFVLPAAECDFQLTSVDKGKLTATPLIGMIFGSCIWGSLADNRGRKWTILACLICDALAGITSAFAQNFYVFIFCRFFNGFAIIGATSLVFSYLGEFLSEKHRDVVLSRLELFWTFGVILLPAFAWLVIPLTPTWLEIMPFEFHSWRLFVVICAMPSVMSAVAMSFFPESPKYLIFKRREAEAFDILQNIYTVNTGNDKLTYPVKSIGRGFEASWNNSINSIIHSLYMSNYHDIRSKIYVVWSQNRALFKKPYLHRLALTCFIDFCLMASYYTMIMWFPDLFDRFGQYQTVHGSDQVEGICDVTTVVVPLNATSPSFDLSVCARPIDDRVFFDTLIVGLSCLPTSLMLGLLINKMGKKYLLSTSLILSGVAALALNWVRNTTENLIVSCAFESIISICETVIFCLVVDLFPTHIRAIALSLTVTSGRIGAIMGNVAFGILIDMNCVIPIFAFATLLFVSGVLCLTIPKSSRRR